MKRTVAVIGGGVAGLAVAYELTERAERHSEGVEVLCLEAAGRAGGNIRSAREEGFLYEWAANGFLDNAPATVTLVRRLGLTALPSRAAAARRFVFRKGRLRQLPGSPAAFLRSDVLSLAGRLRVLAEPLIPARRSGGDESIFDFASRRIGRAAAAVLVDAMVSGIYAGDSRRLSLEACFPKMRAMERDHGGLFRAMLARRRETNSGGGSPMGPGGTLTSFRGGMQELTDALSAALGSRLRLSQPVARVSDLGRRGFRLHMVEGPPLDVDAVALTAPAWESTRLLEPIDRELAADLGAIPSAPIAVVHLGFRRDALGSFPEGFGFLVPRGQGARILGALWASDIFDGRAPAGSMLLTVMIGGAHDEAAIELDDAALVRIARDGLRTTMGAVASPYFVRTIRHRRGIPQYDLGHVERVARIEARLDCVPGLWIGGNSLRGIAINACVEEASTIAEAALAFLDRLPSVAAI